MKISETALVLIDLQKGILKFETSPHSRDEILTNAFTLKKSFVENGGFVVHVRAKHHDDKDVTSNNAERSLPPEGDPIAFAEFCDELNVTDSDFVVNKRAYSAFFGTDLDLQLRRRGIKNIVLGGVATHFGVDMAGRDACQLGYNVYFVEDMMGAPSTDLHLFPVESIFPSFGEVVSTQDVLNELD